MGLGGGSEEGRGWVGKGWLVLEAGCWDVGILGGCCVNDNGLGICFGEFDLRVVGAGKWEGGRERLRDIWVDVNNKGRERWVLGLGERFGGEDVPV